MEKQLFYEYKRISEELNIQPTAYIPSSLDDDQIMTVQRDLDRWAKPRFWWNPYTPLKEKIYLKTARHFF
jgi:hypothetical protein